MTRFLRTRTRRQWAAFVAWAALLSTVAWVSIEDGHTVYALTMIVGNAALFVAAAWMGNRSS